MTPLGSFVGSSACFDAISMSLRVRNSVPYTSNYQHRLSFAMENFAFFDGALGAQISLLVMSKNNIENEGVFTVLARLSRPDNQDTILVRHCRHSRVKFDFKMCGDNNKKIFKITGYQLELLQLDN